jgi:hypothetical protein
MNREGLNLMILSQGKTVYSSRGGGLEPLIDAIDTLGTDQLKNSVVIDKIIGKASALLICYFAANEAIAEVMSEAGAKMLRKHGIRHFAKIMTSEIRNRTGTEVCPFERMVSSTSSPRKAYELIRGSVRNNTSR